MEMHQIRYFLTVAKTLNFTHAAEICHVAQPSLSQAIKKLEEELGGALFRRERSNTHLTNLGHKVVHCLRAASKARLQPATLLEQSRKVFRHRSSWRSPTASAWSCSSHPSPNSCAPSLDWS